MQRNLNNLANATYDLLIIGGGIYGVCSAWDAAFRGLSVAVVDKGDFGQETSSNSLRVIHGGLRYLQHADFQRMHQSITERSNMLRIAPHLVRPLPFVMPTYGHLKRGKELISLALRISDTIGLGRNRNLNPDRILPASHSISKDECLEILPGLDQKNLTGGAIWYDAQIESSERLILSILHSAVKAGAEAANYLQVNGFIFEGDRVIGVKTRDLMTGGDVEIRARIVLNTAGPWINQIIDLQERFSGFRPVLWSKAMNIVVKPKIFPEHAAGLWSKCEAGDTDSIIKKDSRLLCIVPWKDSSIIGTTHVPYHGDPGDCSVTAAEIEEFIDEFRTSYPASSLKFDDVTFVFRGLLPMEEQVGDSQEVTLIKQFRICDHSEKDGIEGLVSVVGVKFTTARDVSQRAVDLVMRKLQRKGPDCLTAHTLVFGGDIGHFENYLSGEIEKHSNRLDPEIVRPLISTYGSAYNDVLKYLDNDPETGADSTDTFNVTKAQVLYGIYEEMAQKLTDIVMRRTDLGYRYDPGISSIGIYADIMAEEKGWDQSRKNSEIDEVKSLFSIGT